MLNRDRGEPRYTTRELAAALGMDHDAVDAAILADPDAYNAVEGPCGKELPRSSADRLVADIRRVQNRPPTVRNDSDGVMRFPRIFDPATGRMRDAVERPGVPSTINWGSDGAA